MGHPDAGRWCSARYLSRVRAAWFVIGGVSTCALFGIGRLFGAFLFSAWMG